MKKLLLLLLAVPLWLSPESTAQEVPEVAAERDCRQLYEALGLKNEVDYECFAQACAGYDRIKHRKPLITLIDFSKPSTERRLYIIDMKSRRVLLSSHVAHGQGSGGNYATSFGNENGSHKSSLGFFLTGETYTGRNGYSMRLHGLESGINDKAFERAVVVHGAAYADPARCAAMGRLGRSFGCPALPQAVSRRAIDLMKDGSVMFVYAPDRKYLAQSELVGSDLI